MPIDLDRFLQILSLFLSDGRGAHTIPYIKQDYYLLSI